MSSNQWQQVTLGDIAEDVAYGYTASADAKPVGPKFLRITDIVGGLNWDTVPYCSIDKKNIYKYKLEVGDIVIARTGATTGTTEIIKDEIDAVFASYLIRFKIDRRKADPFYIGYAVKSNIWKEYVQSIIGGSAQPGANAKQFAHFQFYLPSLQVQKRIASILSSLDDKIELNRQTNQILEAIAQALFKEWFVDFNFPGATGKMVDSELGKIPVGWRVGTVGDVCKNIRVSIHPKDLQSETCYLGLEHIERKSLSIPSCGSSLEVDSQKFKFKRKDILFGKLRPYFHKVGIAPTDGICSTDILVLQPVVEGYYSFVLNLLYQDKFISYVSSVADGTRMPRVDWKSMAAYNITIPEDSVVEKFNRVTGQFFEQIIATIEENHTLIRLRDSLLPKLMNGEINI
jgi:type I restriction enzyme S subunit